LTVAVNENKTGFNTTAVVLLSVAALILLWAFALFLQGGFMAAQANEYAAKVYAPTNESVQAYRANQQAILDEKARWLDKEQGTVVMPIED
jgi:cytochrome oxidase Cu insertion factor (SCO1/SenC/PrrC family)